jgi:uncharacterized protein YndB with AHSA1/START domain
MDGTVNIVGNDCVIRFERLLKHSTDEVWAALTEPDQLHQWLAEPAEIDLRVGGRVISCPVKWSWTPHVGAETSAGYEQNRRTLAVLLPKQ